MHVKIVILYFLDEIVENRREFNLKIDAEDIVQHINFTDMEISINEIIELKKKVLSKKWMMILNQGGNCENYESCKIKME